MTLGSSVFEVERLGCLAREPVDNTRRAMRPPDDLRVRRLREAEKSWPIRTRHFGQA